ncbi:MAG: VCBS repeat-containing protein [Pirellulaceae bacterium]|nr:VCBS repeat-containing protein [Pirellulaceae bacterium]
MFLRRGLTERERYPEKTSLSGQVMAIDRTIVRVHFSVLLLALWVGCQRTEPARPTQSPRPDVSMVEQVDEGSGDLTQVTFSHISARKEDDANLLDPDQDGWESEAFADRAKHRLDDLFTVGKTVSSRQPFFATDQMPALLPLLSKLYQDDQLQIWRQSGDSTERLPVTENVRAFLEPLLQIGAIRVAIKIIEVDEERLQTVALFQADAVGSERSCQQTGRLTCDWTSVTESEMKLRSIRCDDFEQVQYQLVRGHPTQANRATFFADCTQAVIGADAAYTEQLSFGLNHWIQRVERAHGMDDSVRTGLAIGDANGDGLEDLYRCQGPGLPNRLLIQQADGTVQDCSEAAGVDWLDQTSSALFVDLDNDGDQDLAIATSGGLLLMSNDSSGNYKLEQQLGEQPCDTQSLSAADFDQDGDLDLFVCVYRPSQPNRSGDFVFHNATRGGMNYLFQNRIEAGKWSFSDVTRECGLGDGGNRYSLACAWEDFDRDGDQDLYVANDYGRNYLYRNEQGYFTDVTQEFGLADTGFGMSVSWGDVNRDGRMDLYVGNMFSSAGSRVTQQDSFQPHADPAQRSVYRRMAKGNSLFLQNKTGQFVDISQRAGAQMGRWAWSSVFTDFNNDGWEDLIVANGYITAADSTDL